MQTNLLSPARLLNLSITLYIYDSKTPTIKSVFLISFKVFLIPTSSITSSVSLKPAESKIEKVLDS